MLSFAANYYLTGLDPFWFKLTNLVIHVGNGILVSLLLRALFALRRECHSSAPASFNSDIAAAAIAALWLVLPINLTAVLYVSQRLESLSSTFVFLGLWLYVRARLAHWKGERSAVGLWLSLVLCTGIGSLVKESAVMLPLYAACIEFAITGARDRTGKRSRAILALYGVLLGTPLLLGSLWLLSWVGGSHSYARPFDTIGRLMTEARVLIDYITWTLVPQPESMTLYHDDIVVSKGLLNPPSTLGSILVLLGLLGAALWQRKRRPLLTLGILWFFCGHLLTGTVIPLMLAFEHRNYFPSVGLLLAAGSVCVFESGFTRTRARIALAGTAFLFYAFVTWMRAEEWSDPLRLALSEASKRPDSSAAQYELGYTYLHSLRKGETETMVQQGHEVLERASRIPDSDILHEQLLIVSHAKLGMPIEQRWWDSMIAKLQSRPPTTADIGALGALFLCQAKNACPRDFDKMRVAFEAAMKWPRPDGVLLANYGAFAQNALKDIPLAEKEFRASLDRAPNEPLTHANLIRLLVDEDRIDEAQAQLQALGKLNHLGSLDALVSELESKIQNARSHRTALPALPGARADADNGRL
jgi:hypothetical protein